MKLTKTLPLICFSLATATFAHASFDLVCVLDVTNRKIHRIDGDTGVYLGSINDISNQAKNISLDSATGRLYVSEGTAGFSVYNVSTGALLGSNYQPSPQNGTFGLNNNFLFGTFSAIYTYSDVTVNPFDFGSGIVSLTGPISPSLTAISRVGNTIYALDNANKRMYFVNALNPLSSSPSMNLVPGVNYSNRMAVDGDATYQLSTTGALYYASVANGANLLNYNPAGVGVSFTAVNGIVGAHLGTQYLVGTTASGNQVVRSYRSAGGSIFGKKLYTIPGLGSANDVAVMIAPEPGSMAVLGFGLLGLMKRRKK